MTLRSRTAGVTVLVTVLASAAVTTARAADAQPDPTVAPCAAGPAVDLADPAVTSLATDRRIDIRAAAERMRTQDRAGELADRARAALRSEFGGFWVQTGKDDRLAIGVVGGRRNALARQIAADCGLGAATDVVPVAHPVADLKRTVVELSAEIGRVNTGAPNPLGAALLTGENVVELRVPADGGLSAAQQALVSAAQARYGSMLRTRTTAIKAAPAGCDVLIGSCDAPLRAGIATFTSPAQEASWCTLGFLARSRSDGKLYAMTAGHCVHDPVRGVDTRNDVWWARQPATGGFHHIGTPHTSYFDYRGDAALVNVNNPAGWQARAWVWVRPPEPQNQTYSINADDGPDGLEGKRVCHTGYRSGTRCGEITSTYAAVQYGGYPFTMIAMMESNACQNPGDSGGPHFRLGIAYGIHSGGTSGGTSCYSVIQPVTQAENVLNVNVSHDS